MPKKMRIIEKGTFPIMHILILLPRWVFSFFFAPYPHHFDIEIWRFASIYILLKNVEALILQRFVEIYRDT